jgi:alpha-tubulin suppressor-like RCC1 family protein
MAVEEEDTEVLEDGGHGLAYAVGTNECGELGLGHLHTRQAFHFQPVRHFATARDDGSGSRANLRPARHIVAAACGYRYTVAASAPGRHLYSCGTNESFQLGHHDDDEAHREPLSTPPWLYPISVRLLPNEFVTLLACGYDHTIALTSIGRVWSWGERNSGQLGVDNAHCSRPQVVEKLADKRIIHLSAGGSHSLVVTDCGHVWAFGSNLKGQLGNGQVALTDDGDGREIPTMVKFDGVSVVAVSGGGLHSLALDTDGLVYSWGCNLKGQCGLEGQDDILLPRRVHVAPVEREAGGAGWKAVRAGFMHSVLLSKCGSVFCCGAGFCGSDGQLGRSTGAGLKKNVREVMFTGATSQRSAEIIAADASRALAVVAGKIVVWGNPHRPDQSAPVADEGPEPVYMPHPHPRNDLIAISTGPCASHMLFIYHPSRLRWEFERVLWIGLIKGGGVRRGMKDTGGRDKRDEGGGGVHGDQAHACCCLALLPQERVNSSAILRLIICYAAAADVSDLQLRPGRPLTPPHSASAAGPPADRTRADVRTEAGGGGAVDAAKDDALWSVFD